MRARAPVTYTCNVTSDTRPCVDPESSEVRFAFMVPTLLMREVKQIALDREATVADMVREWIALGLDRRFDQHELISIPSDGRMTQYPICLPVAVRRAIQDLCDKVDMSGAQLMRRWMAQGVQETHRRNGSSISAN
jgi:hypothetical protein